VGVVNVEGVVVAEGEGGGVKGYLASRRVALTQSFHPIGG